MSQPQSLVSPVWPPVLQAGEDGAKEVHQILALIIPISLPSISHGFWLGMRPPAEQSPVAGFSKPRCLAWPIFHLLAEGEQSYSKAVPRDRGWRHLSDF